MTTLMENGDARTLPPQAHEEQESEVQHLICDKTPDQLRLKYALWNRDAVRQLIIERYGIDYALQKESLDDDVWFHMTCLGDLTHRIASFFQHPAATYAA